MQTGAAVGPDLGALVYAGLYAVLPEAIAWRALFAAPTSLSPRPKATRCRVRGLRLRNPAFRSGHRTIWDRRSGLAQCRTSCRDSVGRSPRARPAPTTCRRDSAPTSAAAGPEVRRLIPGGRWIRTSGSAPAATPLTDRGVKPQATAAGCHFGEILPQGATLMMALSVSFSRN